jgi:hypothetical protein
VSLLLRAGGDWFDVQSPSIHVAGEERPVTRGVVFIGGQWVRFFPHEETTVTTVTDGLTGTLSVGVAHTVRGEVTPAFGGVAGGTVTVESRPVSGGPWTQIGQGAVAPSAGAAAWAMSATPTECGPHEFRVVYSGTATNAGSETAPVPLPVGLATPAKPVGGLIENEALTFTWAAVPGATSYDVFIDGALLGTVTAATATAVRLKPATAYTFTVKAKRGACESGASPALVGTTSRSTVQDTGSATIKIDPLKTNSYRPSDGWGYISSNVGQGYYSASSNNYTGVIDYGTNAQLKAKIADALGVNGVERAANIVVSKAEVWLYKATGVGSSGSVPVSFFVSTAEAGVGGLPARAGTEVVVASGNSGAGKWYDIGLAHAQALLAGTARSIALFKAATTAYLRMNGKGISTDSCVLRLTVSWDYPLSSAAPGGWA